MEAGVEQKQVRCATCGRGFEWKPELAGRTVKCACGTAVRVAASVEPAVGADEDSGEYDFAEPAPAPKPRVTVIAAPPVGLAAPAGSADEPLIGAAAGAPVAVTLPPQRRGLRPEPRCTDEEVFKPSAVRDWVVPTALIAAGIVLRFVEVNVVTREDVVLGVGPAIVAVAMKLALSVGLMLGGMFLAVQALEVCFLGPLSRTAYKLVAIAVAPGALYGILTEVGGPMYGSLIGTFASVIAFGLLFWVLMRLDLKDASVCVLVTWILITAANYAAYRVEGMISDAWI